MQNPGFELGTWTRQTHTGQAFGEIFVPEHWVAFWREGGPVHHDPENQLGYGRPEMKVIRNEAPFLNPPRIHEGQWACMWFTFYRIHDAGLYQNVAVQPGTRLRFSAWAHAWSSTHDDPHHSDLDGDAANNFTFMVGIDPTGGTDPWGDTVVWGNGAHIYDTYAPIPVVETVAQAATVTFFIRSTVLYPFKHCDAYVDSATLEVVEEEEPLPDGTMPYYLRESYAKTVHVPRPGCTLERWLEIAEIAYRASSTVSGSADDALSHAPGQYAAGIFYDLTPEEQVEYLAFRDAHYPGAIVQFAGESGGDVIPPIVPPVSPRPSGPAILLHWMPTGGAGVEDFMRTVRPPAIKLVAGCGQIPSIRAWSPASLIFYRRVEDDLNRYDPGQAAGFVQRYLVDLSAQVDLRDFNQPPVYIVSGNEWYECGALQNNIAVANWDIAFMEAVERTGMNLRAVVYTAPVGNPHATEDDLVPLLPMVQRACAGGHMLGKHCYYPSVPDRPLLYREVWEWYGGRFAQDDQIFSAHGLSPLWILGEGGACGATVHESTFSAFAARERLEKRARHWPFETAILQYEGERVVDVLPIGGAQIPHYAHDVAIPRTVISLNAGWGWKHAGSIERYRDELLWCNAQYMAWNATHGNRLMGACLFTTYGWGWDSFQLVAGDLDVIAAALAGG